MSPLGLRQVAKTPGVFSLSPTAAGGPSPSVFSRFGGASFDDDSDDFNGRPMVPSHAPPEASVMRCPSGEDESDTVSMAVDRFTTEADIASLGATPTLSGISGMFGQPNAAPAFPRSSSFGSGPTASPFTKFKFGASPMTSFGQPSPAYSAMNCGGETEENTSVFGSPAVGAPFGLAQLPFSSSSSSHLRYEHTPEAYSPEPQPEDAANAMCEDVVDTNRRFSSSGASSDDGECSSEDGDGWLSQYPAFGGIPRAPSSGWASVEDKITASIPSSVLGLDRKRFNRWKKEYGVKFRGAEQTALTKVRRAELARGYARNARARAKAASRNGLVFGS